jgi:hypothetical protein
MQPPMVRPNARQRQFRPGDLWFRRARTTAPTSRPSALHTFDYGQSCKSVATPTHLFSEILGGPIFETTALVGHLSQSNATGRAFGHTKSRRLFSLLGGAERRAGIVVLPPRSTFPPTPPGPRHAARASRLWDPAARSVDVLHSNPDGNRETLSRA